MRDTSLILTEEIAVDINFIFQIAGVGMIVAVLDQLLTRAGRDEQAMLVTVAGLVAVLLIMVTKVGELFTAVRTAFGL